MKKEKNTKKNKWGKTIKIGVACLALLLVMSMGLSLFKPSLGGGSGGSSGSSAGGSSNAGSTSVIGERDVDYAKLYDQDGLIACYTAFDGKSLKLDADGSYSWKNHVADGQSARLTNASMWRSMDGGVGYRWYHDQAERPIGALEIPAADFINQFGKRVEVVAKYLGVTDADTNKMLDIGSGSSDEYFQKNTVFRFGCFRANGYLTRASDKNSDAAFRWYASNGSYDANSYSEFFDDFAFNEQKWKPDENAVAAEFSYSGLSLDEYIVKVSYLSCGESVSYGSAGTVEYDHDSDYTDTVSQDQLTLFNGYPCVIYAVRYYDSGTSSSVSRNFFVDLLAYYKINVSSILKLDETTLDTFLNNCGVAAETRGLVLGNTDTAVIKENRNQLNDIIRTYWPE